MAEFGKKRNTDVDFLPYTINYGGENNNYFTIRDFVPDDVTNGGSCVLFQNLRSKQGVPGGIKHMFPKWLFILCIYNCINRRKANKREGGGVHVCLAYLSGAEGELEGGAPVETAVELLPRVEQGARVVHRQLVPLPALLPLLTLHPVFHPYIYTNTPLLHNYYATTRLVG